jgi:glutamine cyclotransferase
MKTFSYLFFLLFLCCCKNEDNNDDNPPPPEGPKGLIYSIGRTFPHDTSSFTQGLVIYKGQLYEGTGLEGKSRLMQVDLNTGKTIRTVNLDPKYFGEGITILRDTIYQLTWQNKVVLVYTLKDMAPVKQFTFNTEGWGITTDGKELIVSNGSSDLYYYDPATFNLVRKQSVTEAGSLAFNLNELEYINGYIYANQWQAPYILKIDPATGAIVAKADLRNIWDLAKRKDPAADVPNGIAYDSATNKMYVTGKLWPELYEIELSQ